MLYRHYVVDCIFYEVCYILYVGYYSPYVGCYSLYVGRRRIIKDKDGDKEREKWLTWFPIKINTFSETVYPI